MSATARDLPGGALDETIAHVPDSDATPLGPAEAPDMPNLAHQGQHRYIFGSGARPLEGYTIKRAIGRGGFGEVYYATSDAGKEVALKLITRNADIERRGVVQCMNLKSPNLITIYDLKTSEAGDTFVIMEYVAGPSLANVLKDHPRGLPPLELRSWFRGLVEGVAYLHDHGIVHRDLKPANLFLEQGTVKIGDYGLSKLIAESQASGHSESIGTCHYMAPEISTGRYNKPIDIYAMGVILYEMLTGRVPFDGESVGEILMKHLTARPDLSGLPEPYRSIVGAAMAKDPAHRPAHAYQMLPPVDAPKAPEVRFIGQKDAPPPTPEPRSGRAAAEGEDVFRIGPEEPIFYIGPETRPPEPRDRTRAGGGRSFGQWLWGTSPVPGGVPRGDRSRRASARRAASADPVPVPPPPLPGGRIRVAELATSMLWAAPIAALLAVPAGGMLGVDVTSRPEQFAFLFGMTLVGTWGVLIPGVLGEGRAVDQATRRLVYLAVGLGLGVVGAMLAEWTHLHLEPGWRADGPGRELASALMADRGRPGLVSSATYFGLLFGAVGWWKLTARDRPSRFRFLPVGAATLVGLLLGLVWPYPQPWGLVVSGLVAVSAQLVSPWSPAAAAHARGSRSRSRAAA